MILLNSFSSIISETLKLSSSTPVNRLDKLDLFFEDNSGGHFHLYSHGKKEIKLALRLAAWKEIKRDSGLVEMLKEEYGGLWREDVDEGFDVLISCDIEIINTKIDLFSHLKQKIISLPLNRILFSVSVSNPPVVIPLSGKDFYACVQGANQDQIVVLFGMNFVDQTDTVLAKVFLQEFYDARDNRLEDAPVVLYGKEPPKELKGIIKSESQDDGGGLNYLTLVLFPRHYSTPKSRQHLLETVPFLADYIHYHLKCSKAYLHQRMRAKTGEFLKVLNRARPENF